MKTSKKETMYNNITRHGNALLTLFPYAIEQRPVNLCKKLRTMQGKIDRHILGYCNGTTDERTLDEATDKTLAGIRKLLGISIPEAEAMGLFVNRDPRGYALKLDDAFTREYNGHHEADKRIYTDWGGYGILAPDFSN